MLDYRCMITAVIWEKWKTGGRKARRRHLHPSRAEDLQRVSIGSGDGIYSFELRWDEIKPYCSRVKFVLGTQCFSLQPEYDSHKKKYADDETKHAQTKQTRPKNNSLSYVSIPPRISKTFQLKHGKSKNFSKSFWNSHDMVFKMYWCRAIWQTGHGNTFLAFTNHQTWCMGSCDHFILSENAVFSITYFLRVEMQPLSHNYWLSEWKVKNNIHLIRHIHKENCKNFCSVW